MKKKISVVACALAVSLSFAGCSGEKTGIEYDSTMIEQVSEAVISSFAQMGETEFQQFKDLSDYQLEYTMMQSGLPIGGEEFLSMIKAWEAAEIECGEYVEHGKYEIEASAKEITVSTLAKFEDREATIDFKFNKDVNMESMDVSAKYSTGEILKKAGLNTVLGMGTVFVVLIFLSFIISLFKYIPDGSKKAKKADVKEEIKETAVEAAPAEENLADDLELVAVITAAIAAQAGRQADGFVVRSIRRRPSNNWN